MLIFKRANSIQLVFATISLLTYFNDKVQQVLGTGSPKNRCVPSSQNLKITLPITGSLFANTYFAEESAKSGRYLGHKR